MPQHRNHADHQRTYRLRRRLGSDLVLALLALAEHPHAALAVRRKEDEGKARPSLRAASALAVALAQEGVLPPADAAEVAAWRAVVAGHVEQGKRGSPAPRA
jgi:hypothetical protein